MHYFVIDHLEKTTPGAKYSMKQPLHIFQLIPSKRDLQFPGAISKKTHKLYENTLYGESCTSWKLGACVSAFQAGKHNYRPMEQAFPIHSSCKSCRLEQVFKLPFPLLWPSFFRLEKTMRR